MSTIPRIAITPGEPAGIGPDLAVMLADSDFPQAELIAIADPDLLRNRAQQVGSHLRIVDFDPGAIPRAHRAGTLSVIPTQLRSPAVAGKLNPDNADYVLQTLRLAAEGCTSNTWAAMVTGPVQKSTINDAGIAFSGHTEFLAEQVGGRPVMLLVAGALRVALVTTHLPLTDVSAAITTERLRDVITVLNDDLQTRFNIDSPRIVVCGLNPHAGEGGHLGREELDIIIPALDGLRRQGVRLVGPLPADTVFTPGVLEDADAVLAMYHDQGLPVLKHVGFGHAVNVTLGLPIVRTSVDHGTALDLAGTGRADPGSLLAAMELAVEMTTG